MKPSLIGSLQAFVLARPSNVTFILSLFAITSVIFLLAFIIKDKDRILDSRVQEDWESFMEHLQSQKMCIDLSGAQKTEAKHQLDSKSFISPFFPAKVEHLNANQVLWLNAQKKPVIFSGQLSLEGWEKSCDVLENSDEKKNEDVTITLVILPASVESTNNIPSCVHLSGPSHLLLPTARTEDVADSSGNIQCNAVNNLSDQAVKKIIAMNANAASKPYGNSTGCKVEDTIQLSFDFEGYEPKVYLSKDEEMQIFSRLLLAGYFLIGFVSIMLITAVVQGRNLVLRSEHTLLPTKETIS